MTIYIYKLPLLIQSIVTNPRRFLSLAADILLVDHCSLTDSPPNEFHWRRDEESPVNITLNLDDPMPISTQIDSSILDRMFEYLL